VLQVVKENVTVGAATSETGVIFKPVYTAHLTYVAFALHVGRTLASVEVVHRNRIRVSCGKEMTAVAELYFAAALNWKWRDILLFFQTTRKHVHCLDFISKSHNNVETGRVESHGSYFLTRLALV